LHSKKDRLVESKASSCCSAPTNVESKAVDGRRRADKKCFQLAENRRKLGFRHGCLLVKKKTKRPFSKAEGPVGVRFKLVYRCRKQSFRPYSASRIHFWKPSFFFSKTKVSFFNFKKDDRLLLNFKKEDSFLFSSKKENILSRSTKDGLFLLRQKRCLSANSERTYFVKRITFSFL